MPQAHPDLAAALIRLGRIKYDEVDLDVVLSTIVQVAKDTLPGTAEVSVTLVQGTQAHTAAYTGELALTLDEWQYAHGRGPCLDAATTGTAMLGRTWRRRAAGRSGRPGRTGRAPPVRSPSACPSRRPWSAR